MSTHIDLPEYLRPPLRPEPVSVSPAPTPPPGSRWTADRGAIPGEPMYFLDGDPVTARASITERESSGGLLYEPMLADGTSLGVYDDVQVASEAAAYVIDTTHCIHCQRPIAQDDHPGGPRLVHPDLVDGAIDDPNDGTRCGKEYPGCEAEPARQRMPTPEQELDRIRKSNVIYTGEFGNIPPVPAEPQSLVGELKSRVAQLFGKTSEAKNPNLAKVVGSDRETSKQHFLEAQELTRKLLGEKAYCLVPDRKTGVYYGEIIATTEHLYIQRVSPNVSVVHSREETSPDLVDGQRCLIAYRKDRVQTRFRKSEPIRSRSMER